jgi:type II secretory pathway component PulC
MGGILVLATTVFACGRSDSANVPPSSKDSAPQAAVFDRDDSDDVGVDHTVSAAQWEAIWQDAIVAEDDAYVVDSFVAAWLFARAASGSTPEWETIDSDPDAEPAGGYRLREIPPGSPYEQLGLHEGDVVESLNGVVLSGPDRFGFALDGAESLVVIVVHRGQETTRLQYQLVPGASWQRQLADYAGDPDPTVVAQADNEPAQGVPISAESEADPAAAKPSGRSSKARPAGGRAPTPSRSSRPTSRPKTPTPSTSKSHVQCASSTKCSIEEAHFKQLVAAPSRLQSQVDVVPAIRNDVFSGYKLKSVRSGSDAAKLGFKAGDKITHVNGHDLTNDAEALQMYMSLGSSRVFKIRYERNGRRLVKTVSVV